MPRRGGRGRGGPKVKDLNKGRYWNRPQPQERTERPRPPPHLRGRAIGLFYRDLNKNKPKTDHRSFTIGLTIPPRVINQVRYQLQTIANIAKVQNIDLSFVSRFKKIKQEHGVQIKTEPLELENKESHEDDFIPIKTERKTEMEILKNFKEDESFVPLFKSSSSNDQPGTSKYGVKIEISSESEDDEEIPDPTFKKPWSEDLSDMRKYVYKSFNKNQQSKVEHFVGNEDFIGFNKEIKTPTLDPIVIDLDEDEMKGKKIKEEPAFNSNLYGEMTVPKPLMMPKPLADPEPPKPDFTSFKSQPNVSATPDFIPIKHEELLYGSDGRQLSLRGGGDYKYGYKDIITGSFHDKLDEFLAKGVSINITNSTDMKALNETLYEEYIEMLRKHKYQKMLKFREMLPTFKKTEDVLNLINNNSVVVISGETGCGKSTQVPQILLDHALMNRKGANTKILVTQPRRIAASSLAERVAEERGERLGHSVGYAVRLEKVEPRARGSIIYCTTGILLADLEMNQGLTNISHVILDEVHERDTHVDLSMLVLKEILKKRKDLKVILMSATLNAPSLSAYFNNCPVLHIEGLAYPVKDVYLEEILDFTRYQFQDSPDRKNQQYGSGNFAAKQMEKEIKHRADVGPWLESVKHTLDRDVYKTLLDPRSEELDKRLIVCLLQQLCRGEPGAILVFLPGIADITNLLKEMDESGAFPRRSHDIYPLHSKLPSLEQKKIFERPPNGVRKIIIATNIAETSITIDDIVYVIDCGRLKLSGLNVEENIVTLQTEWISKANLMQRRGRAGRCQPGICYHLLTTYRADKLPERLLPELQRCNLLEAVLMIKKLRLGKAEEALQMVADPPAESTVQWAVKHLQQLGALDETETLTPLGWHLARLPVHPAAGKLLLLGALFGCLDRAASVAAVWGFKDPFMLVIGKEKEVDKAKRELMIDEPSDHVAISEAIMTWERAGQQQRTFAYNFFLSNSTLNLLSEMKQQFGDNLKQMGFLASADIRSRWENRNSANLSLFKAVVAAALYPNVANVKWHGLHSNNQRSNIHIIARTPEEGRVEIHPGSVMASMFSRSGFGDKPRLCNGAGANWLVYWLKQRSSKLFLIEVTCVYTLPLLFFGELRVEYDDNFPDDCLISISTVKVKCAKSTADLLFELRALLDHVLASKVMVSSDHAVRNSDFEEEVLNAVIQLITAEDEQADSADDSFGDSDQSDYEPNQRRWRN